MDTIANWMHLPLLLSYDSAPSLLVTAVLVVAIVSVFIMVINIARRPPIPIPEVKPVPQRKSKGKEKANKTSTFRRGKQEAHVSRELPPRVSVQEEIPIAQMMARKHNEPKSTRVVAQKEEAPKTTQQPVTGLPKKPAVTRQNVQSGIPKPAKDALQEITAKFTNVHADTTRLQAKLKEFRDSYSKKQKDVESKSAYYQQALQQLKENPDSHVDSKDPLSAYNYADQITRRNQAHIEYLSALYWELQRNIQQLKKQLSGEADPEQPPPEAAAPKPAEQQPISAVPVAPVTVYTPFYSSNSNVVAAYLLSSAVSAASSFSALKQEETMASIAVEEIAQQSMPVKKAVEICKRVDQQKGAEIQAMEEQLKTLSPLKAEKQQRVESLTSELEILRAALVAEKSHIIEDTSIQERIRTEVESENRETAATLEKLTELETKKQQLIQQLGTARSKAEDTEKLIAQINPSV